MNLILLRAFQSQVALQCRFLLLAADDVTNGLNQQDTNRVFYALQNMLTAGANISKALWGQGGKFSDARRPLRESIGIDDNSVLREVTMRNNFEHFDERLDRWWKESRDHNRGDSLFGPKDMIAGLEDIDKFRHFDQTTGDITFWGQEFSLRDLANEAQRILPKLEEEARKPLPLEGDSGSPA